jgi:hypothetical protein
MKLNKNSAYIICLFVLISTLSVIALNGCKNKPENSVYKLTGNIITDGQNLVQLKCTGCHKLVPVDALSQPVWMFHTLPSMAKYFHVSVYEDNQYYKKNPFDTTGITLQNWNAIVAYYKQAAPVESLSAKRSIEPITDWAGFTLKTPAAGKTQSYTTMAAFNPNNHKIYTSDQVSNKLTEWDNNFKMGDITTLPSAAVSVIFKKDAAGGNQAMLSCIGQLAPMDFPNGKVVQVNLDSQSEKNNQSVIADILARPVQTIEGDFNKDGLTDLVFLGQGNFKGGVYLFKQNPDHTYSQTIISERPGAAQALAGDFNNDGWQDIMILFGTGDEGLWLFLNDHKGGFAKKNLLRFPPVYGSSSFQLADIDHDGKPDLVYTSGYNFHDSRILKPYHGLYIFKNMGNWNFKQQFFYPINGCTKAIAADFGGDGNLDIATIAFFADRKNNPSEGFLYFEADKPFSFKPHAIPVAKYGRWMSMDVSDYNNDGKPDIILGNYSAGFAFQPGFTPFWQTNLPFILLENHIKPKSRQ